MKKILLITSLLAGIALGYTAHAEKASRFVILNVESTGTFEQDVSVGTTLGVTGAATMSSTLDVTGAATLSSTLDVTGATLINNDLSVTGGAMIGSNDPRDDSAILEVQSTSKGMLPPKMNTTQRDNISSPASGLMIYNTTSKQHEAYNGTAWGGMAGASGGAFENYAVDGDCEVLTGWTESDGTLELETSVISENSNACKWTPAAGSDTLTNDGLTITDDAKASGRNGALTCMIQTAGTSHKLRILNAGSVVQETTISASDNYVPVTMYQPFPDSGTATFDIEAGDTSAIYIDECKFTDARGVGLGSVSQAQFLGSIEWEAVASCSWTDTSATFEGYDKDADCDDGTINYEGLAVADASDPGQLPQIRLSSIPGPGRIVVEAVGYFGGYESSGTTIEGVFRFYDGTNPYSGLSSYAQEDSNSAIFHVVPRIRGEYTYDAGQSDTTITIQYKKVSGDQTQINATNGLTISAYYYPSQESVVVTPDVSSWYIDANISGADISLGTSSVATYSDMGDTSLTLTQNSGSASVGIACTAPATEEQEVGDTTCTGSEGNESNGVTFNLPKSGIYEACASFTHQGSIAASATLLATFQVVETPNNATTITTEGNTRTSHNASTGAVGANVVTAGAYHSCGLFDFDTSGQKTLRLYYEQSVGGTVNSSYVNADAAAAEGQVDIHWTVRPWVPDFGPVNIDTPRDEIFLHTHAGYGSSATKIPYFSTAVTNTGDAFTLTTNDATDGVQITINENGVYACNWSFDAAAAALQAGFSLNSSELTTNIAVITAADRLAYDSGNGIGLTPSFVKNLVVGDIIRPHGNAGAANAAARCSLTCAKVSN